MDLLNSITLILFLIVVCVFLFLMYRDEHKRLLAERKRIKAQTLFFELCCAIAREKRFRLDVSPDSGQEINDVPN